LVRDGSQSIPCFGKTGHNRNGVFEALARFLRIAPAKPFLRLPIIA
jgi:hypothetical protein